MDIIDGQRDVLYAQALDHLFRGICLGDREALARFAELDRRLAYRGELQALPAPSSDE